MVPVCCFFISFLFWLCDWESLAWSLIERGQYKSLLWLIIAKFTRARNSTMESLHVTFLFETLNWLWGSKQFLAHMHMITWGCAPKIQRSTAQTPHTCNSVSFFECWCDSGWQIERRRTKAEAEIWRKQTWKHRGVYRRLWLSHIKTLLHWLLIQRWGT